MHQYSVNHNCTRNITTNEIRSILVIRCVFYIIANGFTDNGTVTLFNFGTLGFAGTQTLGGSGVVVCTDTTSTNTSGILLTQIGRASCRESVYNTSRAIISTNKLPRINLRKVTNK